MTPSDGTWNLDGLKLFETPAGKQNWGVIYPGKYDHLLFYCSLNCVLIVN